MPAGSQTCNTWAGELFCCSLFEVYSKTGQNPHHTRDPGLHLHSSNLLIPYPEKEFLSFLAVDNWAWGAILWAMSQTAARDTGHDGSIFARQRGVNLIPGRHPTAGHYSHDPCWLGWWSSNLKYNHVEPLEYLSMKHYIKMNSFLVSRVCTKNSTDVKIKYCNLQFHTT